MKSAARGLALGAASALRLTQAIAAAVELADRSQVQALLAEAYESGALRGDRLNIARKVVTRRKTFGKPICEHQAIQLKLGEMATRTEAARLLVDAAARAFDRGERGDMEAGMAKYFATEAAMDNALECMRIHGAYGYSPEFDVERYYRDAPLLVIWEGTSEVQRLIIANELIKRGTRSLLSLPGAPGTAAT